MVLGVCDVTQPIARLQEDQDQSVSVNRTLTVCHVLTHTDRLFYLGGAAFDVAKAIRKRPNFFGGLIYEYFTSFLFAGKAKGWESSLAYP